MPVLYTSSNQTAKTQSSDFLIIGSELIRTKQEILYDYKKNKKQNKTK